MRKFIISAIVATVAATSFAAPSFAGCDDGYQSAGYYGNDYGYEPSCYTKKVKRWDSYGNLIIKRVRICS